VSAVFESTYADAYDLLYQDKDYARECDVIEQVFQTYAERSVKTILDLGCGTGTHALIMAERGYEVCGVDRSGEMLARARRKVAESDYTRISFQQADIRNFDLRQRFDAVLIMFAVLGYQLENSEVLATLRCARRHLSPGGLLIFDAWYGPAVLHQGLSQRTKTIPTSTGRLIRHASGELDAARQVCSVHYRLQRYVNENLFAETEEHHRMRYFFPLELRQYLSEAGLEQVRLGAFPEYDSEPSEETWNALGMARAI
jgi:SAM-dependent methyltransferase